MRSGTLTLDTPLSRDHAEGEWAGTEFVQERWYPDVDLDNVFWHDHVDGIHGWGKGLVGQLIVEPKGSTYHDPVTGERVRSGNIVDIRTPNPLAPGLVEGSFRELALWTIGDNPATDSTLNLRAEPWSERLAADKDPSLLFSSYRHGDPRTPLPRAYRNDPFVIRTVNVTGNGIDSLHLDGHRFYTERHFRDADGKIASTPQDTVQYGVSSKFTAILEGGAGGLQGNAGDYMYKNGIGRRFRQGAWGLLRVLPGKVPSLQALPGREPAPGPDTPEPNGGRPPVIAAAGQPCPAGSPARRFEVSAVDLPETGGEEGTRSAFVPTAQAADVRAGRVSPEPLVLHAAAGECVTVEFSNERTAARASFHVSKLARTALSSGINAGFNPEQTVAAGEKRTYRLYADSDRIGSATIADFGDQDSGTRGLYGAFVVAPKGAEFSDPQTGLPRDVGAQVDVKLPGGGSYRDFSLMLFDNDAVIGQNAMPYPTAVEGPALVNYRSDPRPDDASAFSSRAHGDPVTPILKAHVGDAMRVHVLGAPGSEQPHVFSLGGLRWSTDPMLPGATTVEAAAVSPWTTTDIRVMGGAGGQGGLVGDMWYGDLRRPFTQAGMWGLVRSLPAESCEILPLDGTPCGPRPAPEPDPAPSPSPDPDAVDDNSDRTEPGPITVVPQPEVSKPVTRLADLRAPKRATRRQLSRQGLTFQLAKPENARVLRVQLVRVGRKASASKRVAVATTPMPAGTGARIVWKLDRAAAARLKPGRYLLRIQAGTDAAHILADRLEQSLELR
jgi:manganese oxidase